MTICREAFDLITEVDIRSSMHDLVSSQSANGKLKVAECCPPTPKLWWP